MSFRPPIVTIMGHIDHGKTTLLDKIRSANVAAREAGGITQHISSYQVELKLKSGKTEKITFIDTPGHAAFCQMRARGAQITDLVVLVVSGVDGIMAQTKECIKEIKAANLPVIIAMTKMDLSGVQPEKVKGQLVEVDLTPEDYGGQTPLIPVSAKTGLGLDTLLDSIFLHAEIMELQNLPDNPLKAFVIESKLDKSRGPVATVLIKEGTLRVGDTVFAENISCKVKALVDSFGKNVKEALPSTPVEVLGFTCVPPVGALIGPEPTISKTPTLQKTPCPSDSNTPRLPIVVKADTEGTLEALINTFTDEVQVISSGVGAVSDNDVFLAQSAKAQIFAFNVPTPKFIKNLADNNKVSIFESKIIYEIIENIQAQVLKLLDPTIEETILAEGKIIAEFKIDKVRIAGIHLTKGEISRGDSVHLKRDDVITKNTKVDSLHQGKTVLDRAKATAEYGITFKPYVDFKLNDVIIAYKN